MIGDAPVAVAVSGGADSFALLHALTERGLPVVALTVDHGLREGSAGDAETVAEWCQARGVPHETLAWEGEKPTTGIQDAARRARYRLLCEACERLGLDRLAAAHTLDDQAETVFMRLRRGAGRGLAGMPPSRKIASGPGEPVTLLRPLLGERRAATRAYTEAHGLPVREDPTNFDERYERVRVRALLAALEEQELLTAEALGRTADAISCLKLPDTDDPLLHPLAWEPSEDGTACVDASEGGDPWTPNVVFAVGGGSSLYELRRRQETGGNALEIGGVLDAPSGNSFRGTLVYREPAALLGRADGTPGLAPVPAPPGSRHLYDRRFIVHVPADAPEELTLRPLGQLVPRDIATSTLARSRVSTLPCLSREDRITHLPATAQRAVRDALSGWKGAKECLPPDNATFEVRSLLAERFANEVIRY
nr:tRNA lysidine(34) synthetase TilS [Parvularcula dongshanensis]